MNPGSSPIVLVPLGAATELLERIAPEIGAAFGNECRVHPTPLDAAAGFDALRRQYRSTVLLRGLEVSFPNAFRVLGITSFDLFVPVLTFVFGEAQMGGRCAIVSTYRLHEEVYGLPPNPGLMTERLLKEAVHELGHTFALRHCDDWTCAMHSTHAVERLDLKTAQFCEACRLRLWGRPSPGVSVRR